MGRRERVKSLKEKGNKGESGKKIEGEKALLESLGKKFTGLRGSRPQSYSNPLSSLSSSQSKDSASSSLSSSTEPPSSSSELAESSPLTTRPLTNDVDSWVDGHSTLLDAKSSRRGGQEEPTHSVVSGGVATDAVLDRWVCHPQWQFSKLRRVIVTPNILVDIQFVKPILLQWWWQPCILRNATLPPQL